MDPKRFNELLQSVREAGAIHRGESRVTVINVNRVRTIRERTKLSQSEFAQFIGVSIKTLQNWEQDRRKPTGLADALLRIIAHNPKLAIQAIHKN